jgi:L-ribulose-5-phosphate 4-epimerase
MAEPLSDLKARVWAANMDLHRSGLVLYTFGNVSGVDRSLGLLVIKPSGVPYQEMTADDMVPVSLETGVALETRLRPSSDTPTHLALYRAFPCGGIVHTHSAHATAFAQARVPIRCMGTTHADFFRGDVPVTRPLEPAEIASDYEANTGRAIVEAFASLKIDPAQVQAVLVANHGPFVWGAEAAHAVENAVILEFLARVDLDARRLAPDAPRPSPELVAKHFDRKHGAEAYYGQRKG